VHPGTGRVCVPIDTRYLESFNPLTVPTVTDLLGEIDRWQGHTNSDSEGKRLQDWEKTSLKPYMDFFRSFVAGIIRDENGGKVKREREETTSAVDAMEF
jgi:DNA primase small subunit